MDRERFDEKRGVCGSAAIRAMLRGKRTVVPGPFNKLSCFGVRFLTRRFASRVATQVLGKPRFVLPRRRGI